MKFISVATLIPLLFATNIQSEHCTCWPSDFSQTSKYLSAMACQDSRLILDGNTPYRCVIPDLNSKNGQARFDVLKGSCVLVDGRFNTAKCIK